MRDDVLAARGLPLLAEPPKDFYTDKPYNYWKSLSHWLKENDHLTGKSRSIVYRIGETLRCKKPISIRQQDAGIKIWNAATKLGWNTTLAAQVCAEFVSPSGAP